MEKIGNNQGEGHEIAGMMMYPSLVRMVGPRQVQRYTFTQSCIHLLCEIFYVPWYGHQIEGANVVYCFFRKTPVGKVG